MPDEPNQPERALRRQRAGAMPRRAWLAWTGGGCALAVCAALESYALPAAMDPDSKPTPLDAYGGLILNASGAPWQTPSGRFAVAAWGSRKLLVTPAGHPYWMRGVFDVDMATSQYAPGESYRKQILAKYGSEPVWARQSARRLRGWYFNCVAEYASSYMLPVALYGRAGNAERMPFMAMIRPSHYSLTNRRHYARAPVKDIVAGTDPAIYQGWRGDTAPDVYDPNFAAYAMGEARAMAVQLGHSKFLVGVATDDADDLYGFGPGPAPAVARTHPNLGWLVLVTNYEQQANPRLGVHYADPRLHAKFAFQQWLRRRYGTIAGLNRAWNARYSRFGSDGGWPHGRGWLDESGRSPWVGRDYRSLRTAAPGVRADLDRFLYLYARRYFQSVSTAVRRYFPGYLVFGPASLNSWNGLTREPILRAAGPWLDVLQASAATAEILDRTAEWTQGLPMVSWTGMAANADSDLFPFPHGSPGAPMLATQAARGQAYAHALAAEFQRATTSGAHPIAGTKFWAWADSWAEKMNWGLVSFRDNAYDGREAIRARGHDRWGFVTGGEIRDYGDCLGSIARANQVLDRRLAKEISAGPAANPRRAARPQ